jgi:hypothetical protein
MAGIGERKKRTDDKECSETFNIRRFTTDRAQVDRADRDDEDEDEDKPGNNAQKTLHESVSSIRLYSSL